jgi:hypothetical protein
MAQLRIETGITHSAIDGAVTNPNIRESRGIVVTNRNVSGGVDHVVADAAVPAEGRRRIEISNSSCRIANAALLRGRDPPLPQP